MKKKAKAGLGIGIVAGILGVIFLPTPFYKVRNPPYTLYFSVARHIPFIYRHAPILIKTEYAGKTRWMWVTPMSMDRKMNKQAQEMKAEEGRE